MQLHLGCGREHLDGWINIDSQPLEGVDQVLDLTAGLPFDQVEFIFAEHFIEHLAYTEAAALLRECRRVLREDGVLRLSTPNLDWVWASHYRLDLSEADQVRGCFALNGAFRAWGHQFLYNERTLAATLQSAGFARVVRCEYGRSQHEALRGLERHEKSADLEGLSHILILEASGCNGSAPDLLEAPLADFLRDLNAR